MTRLHNLLLERSTSLTSLILMWAKDIGEWNLDLGRSRYRIETLSVFNIE